MARFNALVMLALVLLTFISTAGYAQTADSAMVGDSATADSSIASQPQRLSEPTVAVTGPAIEILPFDAWDAALSALERAGAAVERSAVAAVGVQRHDSSVVIVALDSLGVPAKTVQRVSGLDLEELAAVSLKRIALKAMPKPTGGQPAPQQNGRVYFMIHTTVKAAFNYPQALSQALPRTDERVIGGVAMLSIGASLYGSYLFTKKMELDYGKVAIMNCLGEAGVGVPRLIGVFIWSRGAYDVGDQVSGWGSMVGFPLGIWGGSMLKVVENHEYGKAAVMRDFTRWAYLYGFVSPLMLEGKFEDYLAASSALTIAFMPAGFFLGKLLTHNGMSSGRSVLLMVTGAMGAGTGAIAPTWFDMVAPRPHAAAALAGHLGGTAIGFLMYPGKDYSFGQGVFIGASAAVGAAVALAVPLLLQSDDDKHYTIAGTAGAWGGLFLGEWLSRAIFERGVRDQRASENALLNRVSMPALTQIPLLAAWALGGKAGDRRYHADLLQIAF